MSADFVEGGIPVVNLTSYLAGKAHDIHCINSVLLMRCSVLKVTPSFSHPPGILLGKLCSTRYQDLMYDIL